jgi:hypothetical protein
MSSMQMLWISKLSFDADILAFLGSATILATLLKNWATLFKNWAILFNLLVTLEILQLVV